MLSKIWVAFLVLSVLCGGLTGKLSDVSIAASRGAAQAVTLVLGLIGMMSLWSGVMELVSASGLAHKISRLFRPLLRPLFGRAANDAVAMEEVSANVTANLLGLSNAATPIGLRAISRLYTVCGARGAPDAVLTLILINASSLQLIPSTIAAVRISCGAQNPYDILPAVWAASALSVVVAVAVSRVLRKVFPDQTYGK